MVDKYCGELSRRGLKKGDHMPLAYWCVLVAALLPTVVVSFAKVGSGTDNHNPRAGIDNLPGPRRRAYAAHLNAYENFPFFAAAVIIAITMGASISTVNALAVVYIVLRIAHAAFYIRDMASARSLAFTVAYVVNIAIFILPAFK
jgi:uncharacterized MAPEG superfamily protein